MLKSIGDIACFAEEQNIISYNRALDLFAKDKIIPGYECPTLDIYYNIGKDYGWSDISTNIFNLFVEKFGEQTILRD